MSYAKMDHARWMQNQLDAENRENEARAAKGKKPRHPGIPIKLSQFQATVCNIIGVVAGGIYNAPIAKWEWFREAIAVTWYGGELSTHDFDQLTKLVFLAHETRIRISIQPAMKNLRITFHERTNDPNRRVARHHPGRGLAPVQGLYGRRLGRAMNGQILGVIMLNPSTADAEIDDPTIRRCCGFARDGGWGGIIVGNLFAFRATNPKELAKQDDAVGPENDKHLRGMIRDMPLIVCAWGTGGALQGRDKAVLRMFSHRGKVPYALKVTASGHPAHPLYLPRTLRPAPFQHEVI